MDVSSKFTICVLLYGDYPQLAERCIGSLSGVLRSRLRIGCNHVSEATLKVLEKHNRQPFFVCHDNPLKYPAMRALFDFAGPAPISTEYVMWFDDDSWVTADDFESWLNRVAENMAMADVLGAQHRIGFRAGQKEWIESRPWYNGKPVLGGARFMTGGWWTIRTDILRKFDWPDPEIKHRGGDVMLGELCRQHGYRLRNFTNGVAINADASGKMNSSPKRGFDSAPVGTGYKKEAMKAAERIVANPSVIDDLTKSLQEKPENWD